MPCLPEPGVDWRMTMRETWSLLLGGWMIALLAGAGAPSGCASQSSPADVHFETDAPGDSDGGDLESEGVPDTADTGDPTGDDAPSDAGDGEGETEGSCGDGIVQAGLGEACDDGDDNSDRLPDACRTDCSEPGCGDGVVDTGEECDDGDEIDNNECSNGCVEVLGDLCSPCATDAECGRVVDLCVELDDGDACAMDCSDGSACPDNFECTDILSGGTVVARQCLPESRLCGDCSDGDGDGYGVGTSCLGPDCDDTDDEIHPGAAERCDGADNDCDGAEDEDFPALGDPCDGSDADLCANGTVVCTPDGAGTACGPETVENVPERCNGTDDDCDGIADEDFPALGTPCDGGDADRCANGTMVCTADGAGTVCGPETVENVPEICNGADDDCDGLTDAADAADLLAADTRPCERTGGVCAGCTKPASLCSGGAWQPCTDGTYSGCSGFYESGGETSCDYLDNDCDGTTDEMTSSDPDNCGHCGYRCLLPNASARCSSGTCLIDTCYAGYSNCNSDPMDGCEILHNTNPLNTDKIYMGSVCGDTSATGPTRSDRVERWTSIYVEECDDIGWPSLEFFARLIPPSGIDWDLYLYAADTSGNCGAQLDSSTLPGSAIDTVSYGPWGDTWGSDDGRYFCIEVRYYSGSSCSNWTVETRGKTGW
jgi:hypothetical protein